MPARCLRISMRRCEADPRPAEPIGQLSRILLGVGDHLLEVLRADGGMDDEPAHQIAHARHRLEALDGIVGGLAHVRQHRQRGVRCEQEGVAVGRSLRRRLRADHAAGAAAVLDDELLAEGLGQLLRPGTADEVGGSPRRVGQDQLDRLVRPALGLCRGFGREACGQRGTRETQELTTSHAVLPVDCWPQDEGWLPAPSIHRKRNAAIRF
jgi:hypothetical protein